MTTIPDLRFKPYSRDGLHCIDFPYPRSASTLDALYDTFRRDLLMFEHQLGRRATFADFQARVQS